jgi:PPOX class probable F420-dependent enzyme
MVRQTRGKRSCNTVTCTVLFTASAPPVHVGAAKPSLALATFLAAQAGADARQIVWVGDRAEDMYREAFWRESISAADTLNRGEYACMSPTRFTPFAHQKYLNLETYRNTGKPVATPVWFAEENGTFYIYSLAHAGKVKRIRHHPRVRIVPCDVRGNPKGEWVEAKARILDERGAALGHQLLNKKYGWMKRIGDAFSQLRQRPRVVIAIDLV